MLRSGSRRSLPPSIRSFVSIPARFSRAATARTIVAGSASPGEECAGSNAEIDDDRNGAWPEHNLHRRGLHIDPRNKPLEHRALRGRPELGPPGSQVRRLLDDGISLVHVRSERLETAKHLGAVLQEGDDALLDQTLQITGRNAPPSTGAWPARCDQAAADVVAIAGPVLVRVRRGEPLARIIMDETGEQAWLCRMDFPCRGRLGWSRGGFGPSPRAPRR